ncbi:ion transporter [Rhodospirillaceae bacterium SYSU D60014]|uniref:ion transporter n=1 Tax=Virgifigura deserti TaxID=2268457 RepID=UPI000E66A32C
MTELPQPATAAPSERLRQVIESSSAQTLIMTAIILNGITLGLETSSSVMARAGDLLVLLDRIFLAIFVTEIALKIVAYRWRFFTDGWNLFDFTIIATSLAPAGEGLSILRALRVLRVLRLVSAVPQMRRVVQALLGAIPGMTSVIALLALVYYVFGVMATKLFGAAFPDWFGSIGESVYSLFQIMTLESWSMGIVRPVMEIYPYAWIFFVPFILLTSFAVLNLFIALIVNSMQEQHEADATENRDTELAALRAEIRELKELMLRAQDRR